MQFRRETSPEMLEKVARKREELEMTKQELYMIRRQKQS